MKTFMNNLNKYILCYIDIQYFSWKIATVWYCKLNQLSTAYLYIIDVLLILITLKEIRKEEKKKGGSGGRKVT